MYTRRKWTKKPQKEKKSRTAWYSAGDGDDGSSDRTAGECHTVEKNCKMKSSGTEVRESGSGQPVRCVLFRHM